MMPPQSSRTIFANANSSMWPLASSAASSIVPRRPLGRRSWAHSRSAENHGPGLATSTALDGARCRRLNSRNSTKYWEFRGNTVRASDLSGAVIIAHSACPPGARLPAEPHAPLIIANGEYTRMAKADYRTLPDGGGVPKPAERATWLKLACEWLALNSTEACRY